MQSLLQAELATARGRRGNGASAGALPAGPWSDKARITGDGPLDLGCDSLEALWLSSAACEMFELARTNRHHALAAAECYGEWLDIILAGFADGQHAITFSTSGSTGRPKRCTHDLADLDSEARHFAGLFAGSRRVLAFVPAHHIYGFLFTALLPDAVAAEVLDGGAAMEALAAPRPGDLIVAFPERWAWIERVVRRWPAGIRGVTSTAPCPRDLIEAIVGAGIADFTEVYGSSETAGIATRSWPETGYRLLPRWTFAPDEDAIVDGAGRRVLLPDLVERRGADAFVPAGRRDGLVQVGGVNVDPGMVAASLRERPEVADVAVRLMRPDEGLRLKAFVVAAPGADEESLRVALEAWARTELATAARPTSWTFGARLPRNELGKLADWP